MADATMNGGAVAGFDSQRWGIAGYSPWGTWGNLVCEYVFSLVDPVVSLEEWFVAIRNDLEDFGHYRQAMRSASPCCLNRQLTG